MDDYNRGGHSKYSMKVHLIFVAKYRKKMFKLNKQADDVKQFLHDVVKKHNYEIIQIGTDKDHVHIRCGIITKNTYLNSIGNTKYFGLMDISLVV